MSIFNTRPDNTRTFFKLAFLPMLALLLSACTSGALAPGLSERMDSPRASLDRSEALNLINQFRASRGVKALEADEQLNALAQSLANSYAADGDRPRRPANGVLHMRLSAGYTNFAETFSGWRGSKDDAETIADPGSARAGLGVAFAADSTYGVHWVLLLAAPLTPPLVSPEPEEQ